MRLSPIGFQDNLDTQEDVYIPQDSTWGYPSYLRASWHAYAEQCSISLCPAQQLSAVAETQ